MIEILASFSSNAIQWNQPSLNNYMYLICCHSSTMLQNKSCVQSQSFEILHFAIRTQEGLGVFGLIMIIVWNQMQMFLNGYCALKKEHFLKNDCLKVCINSFVKII